MVCATTFQIVLRLNKCKGFKKALSDAFPYINNGSLWFLARIVSSLKLKMKLNSTKKMLSVAGFSKSESNIKMRKFSSRIEYNF